MAKCFLCGNDYDKSFTIERGGVKRVFDSFECAIQSMAPTCDHCGCRIIGHGMEAEGRFFCCAHCAGAAGHDEMRDRSGPGEQRAALLTPS